MLWVELERDFRHIDMSVLFVMSLKGLKPEPRCHFLIGAPVVV